MNKQVICIVGPIASGKGTTIEFLKSKGYFATSTSDRIREEIVKRGQEVTRTTLTDVANELRQNYGNEILAQRTGEIIDKQEGDRIVVDSIRNPEEVSYFRRRYQAKVIAIVANQEKRYEWFLKRTENSEPMTLSEFKELDDKEFNGTSGRHAQNVAEVIKKADTTIDNNGTVNDLERKIQNFIQSY